MKKIYYGYVENKYASNPFTWSDSSTGDSEIIPRAQGIYRYKNKSVSTSIKEKKIKITVEIVD